MATRIENNYDNNYISEAKFTYNKSQPKTLMLDVDLDMLAGRRKSTAKINQKSYSIGSAYSVSISKNSPQKDNDNENKITDTNELMKQLQNNFSIVKRGNANISGKYLYECLTDESKLNKLLENLQAADNNLKSHEGEIGFQEMSVLIDEDGNMTMMSSKSTVTFNESKRANQLAAAQSAGDVQKIIDMLKTDLESCENGVRHNMCDNAEVAKVKKMLERAQQRLSEVSNDDVKSVSSTPMVNILI